jgi:hypothetical protein
VRFFPASKYCPFLKALETMSAISLSSPAMLSGVRLDAFLACMRMPIIRSSRPATIDFDVRSLCAQDTADVLSQNTPMCLCSSCTSWHSRTSQFKAAPASSKSFIVIFPPLLLEVTRSFLMSSGHSMCHNSGDILEVPLVQTPPVPMPQESLYPM